MEQIEITALPAGAAGRGRAAILDIEVVSRMSAILPLHTSESVMDTFGISLHTWTKLRNGEPIRQSVVDRLVQRLSTIRALSNERADA